MVVCPGFLFFKSGTLNHPVKRGEVWLSKRCGVFQRCSYLATLPKNVVWFFFEILAQLDDNVMKNHTSTEGLFSHKKNQRQPKIIIIKAHISRFFSRKWCYLLVFVRSKYPEDVDFIEGKIWWREVYMYHETFKN